MDKKFNFKKKYGQNFLRNPQTVKKIVEVADILPDSLVIEVGPGQGILTKELAQRAKQVLCYEIDSELEDDLAKNLQFLPNVQVNFKDFLTADLEQDLSQYSYQHLYFVSNVPYYITTAILLKLMRSHQVFNNIVMMVQKEVGDRFTSLPGKKDYGSISVYLNYFFCPKKEFLVSRKQFVPIPNVDSVVVSFTPRLTKLEVVDEELFFDIVRKSFQFKRKMLRNNLKDYDLTIIEQVLANYHFDLTVRAENLSVEIFVAISNALSQTK